MTTAEQWLERTAEWHEYEAARLSALAETKQLTNPLLTQQVITNHLLWARHRKEKEA